MPAARQYCLCFYLHHAMLAVGHQLCLTQAKLVQHACHMAANQRVVFVNPYREMTSWGVWWDSSFLNHRVDQNFLVDVFEHCQCVHLATWSVFIRNINRFQKSHCHPDWSGLPTYSPKTAFSHVCLMTPATQWNLNHLSPKVLKDCGTLFEQDLKAGTCYCAWCLESVLLSKDYPITMCWVMRHGFDLHILKHHNPPNAYLYMCLRDP